MIHFMVDFENVRSAGLQGSEYLCADDSVTIFYSECCKQIAQGEIKNFLASGCEVDICKLNKVGKNALDFYIASRIGQLYGSGYSGDIAVVSRDKGFQAVQDYWKKDSSKKIILKPDIAQCIAFSGENSARSSIVREKKKVVNLECEFEKYKERKKIQNQVKELFSDKRHHAAIGKIVGVLQTKPTHKVLYLNMLKYFGKKEGLEIYHTIKDVV